MKMKTSGESVLIAGLSNIMRTMEESWILEAMLEERESLTVIPWFLKEEATQTVMGFKGPLRPTGIVGIWPLMT